MAVSMIIVKRFTYKGVGEEWSNRYYLTGDNPADSAAWATLEQAIVDQEKLFLPPDVKMVRAYGYTSDAENAPAVWSKDRTAQGTEVAGTLAVGTSVATAGDAAMTVRWKTARVSSKGKPIYLRKYYHGARAVAGGGDALWGTQHTALQNFATLLGTGAGVAGRNLRGVGESAEAFLATTANPWLTTRTLKRRGKRPTSAP